MDHADEVSADEVAARTARCEVNTVPPPPGRTYRPILVGNVFSFINNVFYVLCILLVLLGRPFDAILPMGVVLANVRRPQRFPRGARQTQARRDRPANTPNGGVVRDGRERDVEHARIVRGDVLGRYHILMPKTPAQIGDGPYLDAAERVFDQDPSVAVFVYGHTHLASLKEVEDGRIVINTGTWLKMPKKVPVLFGQLPPVYIPAFRLNYFRMVEEDGRLAIYYEHIEKEPARELTWAQRLLTLTKRAPAGETIPKRTVVGA